MNKDWGIDKGAVLKWQEAVRLQLDQEYAEMVSKKDQRIQELEEKADNLTMKLGLKALDIVSMDVNTRDKQITELQQQLAELSKKICDEIYEQAFNVKLYGDVELQVYNDNTKYAQVIESVDKFRLKKILDTIQAKYTQEEKQDE